MIPRKIAIFLNRESFNNRKTEAKEGDVQLTIELYLAS